MEFTAQELMFIFDAVAHMAVRPEFADNPFVNQISDDIGNKIEDRLAAYGYTFKESEVYVVEVH